MSLADFMRELQEQDDIIYSKPPESPLHIIPPKKVNSVISSESLNKTIKKTPVKLKLNLKQKANEAETKIDIETNIDREEIQVIEPVNPSKTNNILKKPPLEPKKPEKQEEKADEIFIKSGTEKSKYNIWIDYYNKAKASKKSNPIVERMKIGRFTITPDDKVLLLPDYDIVGKDPDDVLKDKWF